MIYSVTIQAHSGYLGGKGVMSQPSTETQVHIRVLNNKKNDVYNTGVLISP